MNTRTALITLNQLIDEQNKSLFRFSDRETKIMDIAIALATHCKTERIDDRRTIYAFEVDGSFVRWCGTLEQFEIDCLNYCSSSFGRWDKISALKMDFWDQLTEQTTHFRAVKM
jgi:hypothetical protein